MIQLKSGKGIKPYILLTILKPKIISTEPNHTFCKEAKKKYKKIQVLIIQITKALCNFSQSFFIFLLVLSIAYNIIYYLHN